MSEYFDLHESAREHGLLQKEHAQIGYQTGKSVDVYLAVALVAAALIGIAASLFVI